MAGCAGEKISDAICSAFSTSTASIKKKKNFLNRGKEDELHLYVLDKHP